MRETTSLESSGSDKTTKQPHGPVVGTCTDNENSLVHLTRHPDLILVQETKKGRGIFAAAHIPARTVVDVSPVLVLSNVETTEHIRHTKLWYYTYNWKAVSSQADVDNTPHAEQSQPTSQALPLGLGSLFNHASSRSAKHNVGFMRDFARSTISYITIRDIEPGDELCICYGEDDRLGFEDADTDSKADIAAESEVNGNACSTESFVDYVDVDFFARET